MPERIRIPRSDASLDGDCTTGTGGGAVVAPPHPEYGGARSHPVVRCLADVLAATGRTVVTFDWRGVGASDGRPTGDLAAAVEDYRAAAAVATARAAGPWIAAGYSFGAATAIRVAALDPTVAGLLLVAPPVAMTGTRDLGATTKPMGVVVGGEDDIAPAAVLAETLATMPAARLEVLAGIDHFFFGDGLGHLRTALTAVVPSSA